MGNVHEATVVGKRVLARGVVEWRFRADEPLKFRPGQFLSVRVGTDDGGASVLRSYSLASSPGEPEIALILKLVPGGPGSHFFEALKDGERVRFTGPMGFFVLDLQHGGDVVFGATGVGIAPVLPMLDEVLARSETGRVRLYWGNRDAADLFWLDQLAARAKNPRFEPKLFLSGAQPAGWTGGAGRINPAVLADLPQFDRPIFYLVGNGAMIRELRGALVERGIDRKKQVRNEAFYG
jgi:ferredoxin-NADP reductase